MVFVVEVKGAVLIVVVVEEVAVLKLVGTIRFVYGVLGSSGRYLCSSGDIGR
jgi:hypothetical protein